MNEEIFVLKSVKAGGSSQPLEGYLYSYRKGKFIKRSGYLHNYSGRTAFYYFDKDTFKNIRVSVPPFEGKVYNKMIWLRENNERRALDILIKDAKENLKQLYSKCKTTEDYLKSLEAEYGVLSC